MRDAFQVRRTLYVEGRVKQVPRRRKVWRIFTKKVMQSASKLTFKTKQ